ncbi:MAG: hypothetical protein RMI79_05865 [Nitrososphaerota archaeon]|nr:hypothetical protein [Nitrososphaerota archaeon]
MHSRTGLTNPYLSNEWMDCMAVCIEEGEKWVSTLDEENLIEEYKFTPICNKWC